MRIQNAERLIISVRLENHQLRSTPVEVSIVIPDNLPSDRKLIEAAQRAVANALETLLTKSS